MNTADDEHAIASLDAKVRQVFRLHENLQHALAHAEKTLAASDPLDDETRDRFRQLVLQLRLDNEDTLRALIMLHNNYCMALGINPLNSELTNLERLQYSLGDENVTLELTWLHDLIDKMEQTFAIGDKLRRAEERQRKLQRQLLEKLRHLFTKHPEFQAEGEALSKELAHEARLDRGNWDPALTRSMEGIEHDFLFAAELELQLQFSVEQLSELLHQYVGLPQFGLIHDYLAGLQGPISQFLMAYQSGLGVINKLANLVTLKKTHSNELTNIKQQIVELTVRLENAQKQQRASLMKTLNQQQHLQALSNRLQHKIDHPSPQLSPTVTPTDEQQLESRMQLRRTLRMFP